MKAKVVKTGEMVEVYHEPQHGQTTNIYKECVLVNGRMWPENELTWEDIENIITISYKLDKEEEISGKYAKLMTHYQEVLKRFKEEKEKIDN